MKIETTAKLANQTISWISLAEIHAADQAPKVKRDSSGSVMEMRLSPTGEQLYSYASMKALSQNGNTQREEQRTYLALTRPVDVQALVPYILVGRVWVESFSTRDGLLTTVIADSVELAAQGDKQ